jgi:hypothetical protein
MNQPLCNGIPKEILSAHYTLSSLKLILRGIESSRTLSKLDGEGKSPDLASPPLRFIRAKAQNVGTYVRHK